MENFFTPDQVQNIRQSENYMENEIASNEFIVKNLSNCVEYGKKWSSDPFHAWSRQFEYPWVAQQIKNLNLNKSVKIMDAGSGYTYFPYYLLSKVLPHGSTVDCIDYDPWLKPFFRSTSHSHQSKINYQTGNLVSLSKKNYYDIIYSISTLEHSAHELFQNLVNLYDALVVGGYLILTMDISPDGMCDIDINMFRKIWSLFKESKGLENDVIKNDDAFSLNDALDSYSVPERWMNSSNKKLQVFWVILQKK